MHGIYFLIIVFPFYAGLSFLTNQLAVQNPTHHDVVYLYSEWADEMILVLIAIYFFFMLVSRPNYDLLAKRIALCFVLKGITQFLTITPQPRGVEPCRDVSFLERNCADMMFSGHTALTYLVLYKTKWRNFLTFAMAWQLVFADWHYMSDTFVAVIVGYAIEKYLPPTFNTVELC
tara:strand:+ start:2473 stop:2997 length:525 start_codon:yes stop_codon:yes gene_type:complete